MSLVDENQIVRSIGHLGIEALRVAVHFHNHHRAGVGRESQMEVVLDDADDFLIHELQRRGDQSLGDDGGDGAPGGLDGIEGGAQGAQRGRVAEEADLGLRHHAQGPLAAGEKAHEVVFGPVEGVPAKVHGAPVGEDDLQAGDVVGGDAVLEAVWPAGVGRDVASQGCGASARRVGGKVQPARFDELIKGEVDDAGLHGDAAPGHLQVGDGLQA
ncbi:MAG: hypothetical protein BWY25_01773 [Chloroflexi bacterium ADurb.Bin222]|nr:MAG: hypothetical protein BWY25_01773 [Chloroflexi bacterium ADurb.Bin222]